LVLGSPELRIEAALDKAVVLSKLDSNSGIRENSESEYSAKY